MKSAALILERFDMPAGALAGAVRLDPLHTAYDKGFSDGRARGLAEAREAAEQAAPQAADALLAAAETFARETAEARGLAREEALAALSTILSSVFPELARRGFPDEAAAVVRPLLERATFPALQIAVNPHSVDALKERLGDIPAGCDVVISGDASIKGAEAQARWTDGGLDFDLNAATAGCLSALENALNKLRNGSER